MNARLFLLLLLGLAAFVVCERVNADSSPSFVQRLDPPVATAFGWGGSVAIDADMIVVGSNTPSLSGVTVFDRNSSPWSLLTHLSGGQSTSGTTYGMVVDVDNGAVLVSGVATDPRVISNLRTGTPTTVIYPNVGQFPLSGVISGSLDAGRVAAGVFYGTGSIGEGVRPGDVYVAEPASSTWTSYRPVEVPLTGGAILGSFALSQYGFDVAIQGSRLAASYPGDRASVSSDSSVYVLDGIGGSDPAVVHRLTLPGRWAFGASIDLWTDLLVVGSPSHGTADDATYVYQWDGTTWSSVAQLTPDGASTNPYFGVSVAIEGEWAVVGAPGDDEQGTNAGAAYVYRLLATGWTEVAKLMPDDLRPEYKFGHQVAISGNSIVVGAPGTYPFLRPREVSAPRAEGFLGAVYVYAIPELNCVSTVALASMGIVGGAWLRRKRGKSATSS